MQGLSVLALIPAGIFIRKSFKYKSSLKLYK